MTTARPPTTTSTPADRSVVVDHLVDPGHRTEPCDHRQDLRRSRSTARKSRCRPTAAADPPQHRRRATDIITVGGFLPKRLYATPSDLVVWTNLTDQPQQVVFDHFAVRSPVIPPGGKYSWTSPASESISVPLGLRHARCARPETPRESESLLFRSTLPLRSRTSRECHRGAEDLTSPSNADPQDRSCEAATR